jgi:hypothetical protein
MTHSGLDLLTLSSSHFDPLLTSAVLLIPALRQSQLLWLR